MIECPERFLPLGSVVRLRGGDRTMMVIGRALTCTKDDGTKEYYDYGFVLYPSGVMGDALIYSNHDCIEDILFEGFSNEQDEALVAQMMEILPQVDLPRGNPQPADEW